MKYPDIKKGIRWCLIVGGVIGAAWFALACWLSTLPAVTDVSLSLALRPWWKNWSTALFFFLVTGLPVGILAAFRPDVRRHKKIDDHDA
jgi:hypothetical protein